MKDDRWRCQCQSLHKVRYFIIYIYQYIQVVQKTDHKDDIYTFSRCTFFATKISYLMYNCNRNWIQKLPSHSKLNTFTLLFCRVRPLGAREVIDCCRVCTNFVAGEPQIILGSDKGFTYDNVYDLEAEQNDIFKSSIESLVDR